MEGAPGWIEAVGSKAFTVGSGEQARTGGFAFHWVASSMENAHGDTWRRLAQEFQVTLLEACCKDRSKIEYVILPHEKY